MAWYQWAIPLANTFLGMYGMKMQYDQNEQNLELTRETNELNWQRAKELEQSRRNWAIQDREFENRYNSPEQQMKRYQEAGLNSRLIYGQANNAMSATTRTTPVDKPSAIAPRHDISSMNNSLAALQNSLSNILEMQRTSKQLELYDTQMGLLKANTAKSLSEVDTKNFDLDMKRKLADNVINTAQQVYRQNYYKADIYQQTLENMPSREMAINKYLAETSKTNELAAHAHELFLLAQKENLLKQQDIDAIEKLLGSRHGQNAFFDIVKIILTRMK